MKTYKHWVALLLILSTLLAGCATATPTPTPTRVPPTPTVIPPTPVPTPEPVALSVGEREFGLSQLRAMPQKRLEVDGQTFDGVPMLELLREASIPAEGTLVLVAGDGYSAELSLAKMDSQSLLAINQDSSLQSVVPGQGKGTWVKNLVKIEYKADVTAEAVLSVAGQGFTFDELKALPVVKADVEGVSYTGVGLLDLLAAAGLSGAEAITLEASDGYKAEVKVAELSKECMLAFGASDALDAVLPGLSKGGWVRGVVAVNAVGGDQPILTVCEQPFNLAQLKALPEVAFDFDGKSYKGVGLLDLLKAAKASGAVKLTLVASDGYTADVEVKDLDAQSILNWVGADVLDAVIPSQVKGKWVKGTVEIKCVIETPKDTVLTVDGMPFTMDDLKALEQVTVEVEGSKYTGIRLLDLLNAAGATGDGAKLVASDGYQGQVAIADLDEQSILAYDDQGGVSAVFPGISKGSWVKYIVSIEVSARPASETGPVATPLPLDSSNSILVTDSIGTQVTIPKVVNRVASMRSGITEIICALGEQDKIVAVEEMVNGGFSYGEFITKVHPELMKVPAPLAGKDLSAEEMLRLGPDLVLHGGYGRIQQAESLRKQAPTLPVVIAHFETLEAYMDDIRLVAKCVNAEDRAETLIAYLEEMIENVRVRVADIPEDKKVRVMYGGHTIWKVYTPDTFEHAQIDVAGGVNVARELTGWMPEVSAEQIIIWDPEVIIVLGGVDVQEILNDARVAGVSAIKNKRVYSLPESGWDFSTPRALFCMHWLASKLYPERYSDVDITQAANEFYQTVFGVDYFGPPLK